MPAKTRRGSPLHITPSFELFGKSKKLVMSNIGIFAPLYLLPFLFMVNSWTVNIDNTNGLEKWSLQLQNQGGGFNTPSFPSYTWGLVLGFSALAIIGIIISLIIQIMTQAAQLEVAQGKKPTFSGLWATTKELGWRMVGLYLLIGLYIVVGLILLIIPGLIMLRRYFLAPYVLLDQKGGIREAMDRSAAISKPYSGYVWGVIGVMILISALNIIPLIGGLAAFVLGVLYSVAPAIRYGELKKLT